MFKSLKEKFSEHVLLNHYRSDCRFCLQTDSSRQGIRAILFQRDDDDSTMIISLISRCLSSFEKNYTSTEIELLAIVYAVIKL